MRTSSLITLVVIALFFATNCAEEGPTNTGISRDGLGEEAAFMIAWNGHVPADADEIIALAGGTHVESLDAIAASLAVSSSPDFAAALGLEGRVSAVGLQNYQTLPEGELEGGVETAEPVEPGYFDFYQWDIRRVRAPEAWEINSGSHDTVVAVLDTGVAWNHPDLAPNVVFATCGSVLTSTCSPYPTHSSHGTHVAGTIAGSSGYGMVGVGPNLAIASYNVFEYYAPYDDVVAFDWVTFSAMIDAAERGFDVINMSLGGYVVRPESQEDVAAWTLWNRVASYVTREGVTIIASSGNGGLDLNGPVAHVPSDVPNVVSVGATGVTPVPFWPEEGVTDVLAFYSNTGAAVDISAPGGDLGPEGAIYPAHWHLIFSTYVYADPTCAATYNCDYGWAWMGGTSMASPHVAGVAGLVRDTHADLTARQTANVLKRTAESLGDRLAFGHGMVDAYEAIQ